MKTITTIREYQETIDEVRNTKQSIKVIVNMSHEELEKRESLNMEGVDIEVTEEYDEIKPI